MKQESALFGRDRERELLRRELEDSSPGRASVVMLAGDPGAGKSSLLADTAAAAESRGWLVLRAGLGEDVAQPPYALIVQAIRPFAGESQDVAGLLAEMQPRETSAAEQGEFAHLRLFEATADLIAGLAGERPVALLLDDLQWSDPSSLLLLTHLLRRSDGLRCLVVGAYRELEVEKNEAAARFLAEQNRLRRLRTIAVKPLPPDALADLARQVLNGQVSSRLLCVLNDYSEGNPFFAEELLRGWQERGEIAEQDGVWTIPPGRNPPPPQAVMLAVRQQLAKQPDETVNALRMAAAIGRSFSLELLSLSVRIGPIRLEEILEPALTAGFLRPGAGDELEFRHDIVRASLVEELSVFRRRQFHYSIAMAIESLRKFDRGYQVSDLAFHFARSGNREKTAQYAAEAGRGALSAYAYAEASDLLRTALDASGDTKRGELLLDLGRALLLLPDPAAAEAVFKDAFHWFSTNEDWRGAGIAASQRARALWRREALAEAAEAFDQALNLIESLDPASATALLADHASFLGVSLGRLPEGVVRARQAVDASAQLGDKRLEAVSRRVLGNLLARGSETQDGIASLQSALDLAVAAGDYAEAAECCACLVSIGIWTGDVAGSYEAALKQVRYAELSHDLHQLRHVYCWIAMFSAGIRPAHEADEWFEKARAVVERLDNLEATAFYYQSKGTVATWKEEYPEAVELFGRTVEMLRPNGVAGIIWYLGPLGVAQANAGMIPEARQSLDELAAFFESSDEEGALELEGLTALGLIAARLGDRERADAAYERLKRYAGRSGTFFPSRVMAAIDLLRGNIASARAHVRDAERESRDTHFPPELGTALQLKADIELAAGSAAAAREALTAARELYERLGYPKPVQAIEARLAALEAKRPAHPNGISERELEVLRLVVAGKTNPEIAKILSISRKTVANHLTAILTKTGTDNRAAATAYAIRNGLAR